MKAFLRMVFTIAIVFILSVTTTGCGTLNRNISLEGMSSEDMQYARVLKEGVSTLSLCTDFSKFATKRTANKVYPILPFFYWESLGVMGGLYDSKYGYMEFSALMPIYFEMNAASYGGDGSVSGRHNMWCLSPVFEYFGSNECYGKYDSDGFNILPIPIVHLKLYGQMTVEKEEKAYAGRYDFLYIPIIGPCFTVRYGPNTGKARFFWIPVGEKF